MIAFARRSAYGLICALIGIGALASCTATATPAAVPTLTLIPGTATATATPLTPLPPLVPSDTPLPQNPTAGVPPIVAILETTVTPDVDLTSRIIRHLANDLSISTDRIQLVTIEAAVWYDDNLGCDAQTTLGFDEAVATYRVATRVSGFRYVLLIGNTVYEYHTEGLAHFVQCLNREHIRDELLLAVDPVAVDMVQLVQRRVAHDLDLSTRRVQISTVVSYIWPDTSLGCPQPGQSYTPGAVPGYRIVVSVAGSTIAFHSDAITAITCELGDEVLPD